jgi:hypothetical protein
MNINYTKYKRKNYNSYFNVCINELNSKLKLYNKKKFDKRQ